MAQPEAFTKQAIEHIAKLSGLPFKTVQLMLKSGWTFSWDIKNNLSWTRNALDHLMVLGRPSGSYPQPRPTVGPKGGAGDSGASPN